MFNRVSSNNTYICTFVRVKTPLATSLRQDTHYTYAFSLMLFFMFVCAYTHHSHICIMYVDSARVFVCVQFEDNIFHCTDVLYALLFIWSMIRIRVVICVFFAVISLYISFICIGTRESCDSPYTQIYKS